MSITNFNTANQTFRKLMGNGLVYRVPTFQRDYSWTDEEWDDLWQDILPLLESNSDQGHYMGYLVLQSSDERNFEVIDGQQRVTTLMIIVLAVLNNLKRLIDNSIEAENNQRRADELRKTYVGFLDPVTLVATSKLRLNRHNDRFLQNYLIPLVPAPRRNLSASENQLRKAFDWFDQRIRDRYESSKSGSNLARFLDTIADRLFFTVIAVNDELNAFRVFETLNARGVRLSSTDLLKNHLFSIVHRDEVHENELTRLEEDWEELVGKLGSESVPDFLRVFWNSRHSMTRQADLFKTLRAYIQNRGQVFQLLRDMLVDADVYAALGDPGDRLWKEDQREYIEQLRLFGVRKPFPLLLTARRVFAEQDFTRILRACSIISFRYNTIGNLGTSEQERTYHDAAEGISNRNLTSVVDVLKALKTIYPSDSAFRAAFAEKQLRTTNTRNRQIARYILFELERQMTDRAFDPDYSSYNIEHILPEHPRDGWAQFTDDQVDRCIYRLGNLTLMKSRANREIGNDNFDSKRQVYSVSEFEMTRRLAEETEWTERRIEARQKTLASLATGIWKISELG